MFINTIHIARQVPRFKRDNTNAALEYTPYKNTTKTNSLTKFHHSKIAAFSDVKEKGRRIYQNGEYRVYKSNTYSVLADVQGDNDIYTVYINDNARVDRYENNIFEYWQCTCKWSEWAWNRETYYGRICSHVYAMYLLLRDNKKGKTSTVESQENAMSQPDNSSTRSQAENMLMFIELLEAVSMNFEGFYGLALEGYATADIAEVVSAITGNYSVNSDEVIDMVKLAITYISSKKAESEGDIYSSLKAQVAKEELQDFNPDNIENIEDYILAIEAIEEEGQQKAEMAAEQEQIVDVAREMAMDMMAQELAEAAGIEPEEHTASYRKLSAGVYKSNNAEPTYSFDEDLDYDPYEDIDSLIETDDYLEDDEDIHSELENVSPEKLSKVLDRLENAIDKYSSNRKTVESSHKRAGRIFTEDEKIALINEDGISKHVLLGKIL